MNFVGWDGTRALFSSDNSAVVVDSVSNVVHEIGILQAITSSGSWKTSSVEPDDITKELASAALTEMDITVLSNDRMYTIPAAAKAEAKRALEWRKEHKRGGTSVGLNTARTLAKGGQVGIKKVRHIAKYFPRHEVDKKAKGYKPGEDGYPSNGRIAWALWGGDAAQRWASNIVEREDKKKGLTAGHYMPEPRVDYKSFEPGPMPTQFFVRIRLDGTGIDRLYRMDHEGNCHVWDDGCWEDMGNIAHDFMTYDRALDDPYDTCKKIHVPVDEKTAIAVSAMFDTNPFSFIALKQINEEETSLFEKGYPGMEWGILDQLSSDDLDDDDSWDDLGGLMAAAESDSDGIYTEEERSENASRQVRDAMGRFATSGSSVIIGGNPDYSGTITGLNPDAGTVTVRLANGESVDVPGSLTQEVSSFEPVSQSNFPSTNLDFTGILGEPRVPIDQPLAQLPGRLPPLSAPDVNLLVNDWSAWVSGQRLAPDYSGLPLQPFVPKRVPDANTAMGRYYKGAFNPDGTPRPGWNPAIAQNVYNEPLLRNWLDQKYSGGTGKSSYQNIGWYKPPIEDKLSSDRVNSPAYRQQVEDRYNRVLRSSLVAAADEAITPETSDVPAMYLAIVAEDDPQAVMDLVSVVPASKDSTEAVSFVRKEKQWVRDDRIIRDLKSATPPPVVVLSNEDLSSVVEQVDGVSSVAAALLPLEAAFTDNAVVRALVSAGGLDRNRGNAEKLRRYWTIGRGALKIRWNTPGDWTRCYRNLAKYMGPRAKGYCALRHKEMTGVWPGSKYNVGKKKKKSVTSSALLASVKPEEQIISEFALRARAEAAKSKMIGRHGVQPKEYGATFIIPLVIPEQLESGDGRYFIKDSIEIRELPLPLMWQVKSGQGHDGSVVVGQITHMEKTLEGIGNAFGVFDNGPYGREAERLVRHGFIRGVSADMDKFEAEEKVYDEDAATKKSKSANPDRINIKSARVMAVTIVPKPAFQECFIQVVEDEPQVQENKDMIQDGVYIEDMDAMSASAMVACGMVASSIPLEPPLEWFENPKLRKATPLTILDDGRVFGHIAAWHVDHIGMSFGTKPPRSRSQYAYFHTGALKTEEGVQMPVGQLTLAGGHAGLEASAEEAVRHYDDTASAFADVHAGEDAFGIWVAGALRPGITPEQIRAARASAPSGDWRPINGRLELVAVCQVNVPGFPIARARVASGQVLALVAAGASVLAQMRHDPLGEVIKKIEKLEATQNAPLIAAAEDAKARVAATQMSLLEEKKSELAARVNKVKKEDDYDWGYMIQMLDGDPEDENPEAEEAATFIPRRIRERLAREGMALPDGSFPIRNIQDLRNAVRSYGRARPGARGEVRRHIIKRARGLRRQDLIPAEWKRYTSTEEFSIDEAAFEAGVFADEFADISKEVRMKLAKEGRALPDGSFPIRNIVDLKNAIQAHGRAKDIEKAKRHIKKRARALGRPELIPDEWSEASVSLKDRVLAAASVLAEKDPSYTKTEALFANSEFAKRDAEPEELTPEELEAVRVQIQNKSMLPERDDDGRIKYTPQTQPRDARGKFRRVLARLKQDLGVAGLSRVMEKVEKAENLDFAGDYAKASGAAADLISIIDRLDTKALNPESIENVRNSAAELGRTIANLPFAFGEQTEKIRFSDVPPALRDLMEDMIDRVHDKIEGEDGKEATADLRGFMSGGDYYSQADISSQMSKLLRLLT
jgi:hypothetical protein